MQVINFKYDEVHFSPIQYSLYQDRTIIPSKYILKESFLSQKKKKYAIMNQTSENISISEP